MMHAQPFTVFLETSGTCTRADRHLTPVILSASVSSIRTVLLYLGSFYVNFMDCFPVGGVLIGRGKIPVPRRPLITKLVWL